MALAKVKNGSVTLPTGYAFSVQSFSYNEGQAVEDVTPYSTSITYSQMLGSGLNSCSGTISGYVIRGSNPGLGVADSSTGDIGTNATLVIDNDGSSATTNIVGAIIITGISLSHSRLRPGVPVSLSWVGTGEFTHTFTGS